MGDISKITGHCDEAINAAIADELSTAIASNSWDGVVTVRDAMRAKAADWAAPRAAGNKQPGPPTLSQSPMTG